MEETRLAVLIDFENIAAGTEKEGLGKFDVDALMARIKDKGRILVARSYGDWGRFARFKQALLTANVTMMELTSHGMQDKNRADIAMVSPSPRTTSTPTSSSAETATSRRSC